MYRCHICATVWEQASKTCPFCGGHRIDIDYRPSPYAKKINAAIQGYLQPVRERLVEELKEIVHEPMPGRTRLIEFELHFSYHAKSFPIRWDPKDSSGEPLFGGDPLLDGKAPVFPRAFFDTPAYEDLDLVDFGFRAIETWFGECWQAAGGATFPHPAYFRLRDSHVALDLRTRKLVKESERWLQES